MTWRYKPELQLQLGKFKTPVGPEQMLADRDLLFNERSLVTDLVPNRDLGARLQGELFLGVLKYAAGVFNGVGDSRNSSNGDFSDGMAFAGRVLPQPFARRTGSLLQGLAAGVGGSYEDLEGKNTQGLPSATGGALQGYTTVGQQQLLAYNPAAASNRVPIVVADGEHRRVSPHLLYAYGPYSPMGEYAVPSQTVSRTVVAPFLTQQLNHDAWQVTAGWVLTGEDYSFSGGVNRRRSFRPADGGWGALQFVTRYSELDVDNATFAEFADPSRSASLAREWSVGLNWWLNKNVRLATSFSRTTFEGGARGQALPGVLRGNRRMSCLTGRSSHSKSKIQYL
jgi:phosphate-selective porin OprO/OprP